MYVLYMYIDLNKEKVKEAVNATYSKQEANGSHLIFIFNLGLSFFRKSAATLNITEEFVCKYIFVLVE